MRPAPASLLPWHEGVFAQLRSLHETGRLGHAWLVTGLAGTGKLALANSFAQYLFCSAPQGGKACGTCADCLLFAVEARSDVHTDLRGHPDLRVVQPEKALIKVEQVRDTIDFAQNTSQRGGMRVLIFEPAEAMNSNAANALLKLLEEPPQQTLLLLISHQPGLLLATIRSRCQVLRCALPPTDMAARWLENQGMAGDAKLALLRAGGAPLRALAENEAGTHTQRMQVLDCLQGLSAGTLQPVEAAKKCEKFDIEASIDYQLACAADLSAFAQGARALRDAALGTLAEQLRLATQPVAFPRLLHRLYGELQEARRVATASNNANQLLILEALFGRWLQLGQHSRKSAAT
jgi:DNA polymerase-3 subunit delta'